MVPLWPIATLVIVFGFRKQIGTLIRNIGGAKSMQIGDMSWSMPDVDDAITEREILRAGISLVTSDKSYHKDEMEFLKKIAWSMSDNLGSISQNGKHRIMREVIAISASDNDITKEEYKELKHKAKQLKISVQDLNLMIVDLHNTHPQVQLPSDLNKFVRAENEVVAEN